MDFLSGPIKENFYTIKERMAAAVKRSGREPSAVRLVVVTKAQPAEKIRIVIEAGADQLGENYPEETVEKKKSLSDFSQVQWHMIGHLQSRKIPYVIKDFNIIHSIDSVELATKLSRKLVEAGIVMPVLIEINSSGEESKYGFPGFNETDWGRLVNLISTIVELPGIKLSGLMTMPPFFDAPELSRPYFIKLRTLRDYLQKSLGSVVSLNELSMGTSSDFEVAIEEGATYVRVGKAIMGERIYP